MGNQSKLRETMNDIELQIGQMLDIQTETDPQISQLRDHMMDLYHRTVTGLLKKVQSFDQKFAEMENEWQATCDKLIDDQQIARQEQERLEEKLEIQTQDFNKLKGEHYQLVNVNKENQDRLSQEMANQVNSEYLKNIILSYFMTPDPTVQKKLMLVVFQAMKFTEEEQEKALDAHTCNSQSSMAKMIDKFF